MRVLVVDDEKLIRDVIKEYLLLEKIEVEEASNGEEALNKVKQENFDIIIMDIMMPKMDGYTACREIKKIKDIPFIMLSARGEEYDKLIGFDLGIDDYVTKPFSTEVLLARIRANLRRTEMDGVSMSKPQTYGDLTLDIENSTASVKGKPLKLRSKELALLFALAERQGMLCRRTWLTQKVWKEDYLSTSRTIDVHIRRLRSVLDEVSDYRYIHTVHGMGYRFEPIKKIEE